MIINWSKLINFHFILNLFWSPKIELGYNKARRTFKSRSVLRDKLYACFDRF